MIVDGERELRNKARRVVVLIVSHGADVEELRRAVETLADVECVAVFDNDGFRRAPDTRPAR